MNTTETTNATATAVASSDGLGVSQPTNLITFHAGEPEQEIMRLDSTGMTYKGQRIEDGGTAHKAFLEVMAQMRQTPNAVNALRAHVL